MWYGFKQINRQITSIQHRIKNKQLRKFFSKSKSQPYGNYSSLAPKDHLDKGVEYIRALNWAIKQKDIHNIAVTGPYGSGKSSVINSFLKFNKHIKTLRLSLAAFKMSSQDVPSGKSNKEKNKLEEEFLKQIFYSVSSSYIPESRYRRITPTGRFRSSALAIVILATIIGYVYFFKTAWIELLEEKLMLMPDSHRFLIVTFSLLLLILLGCAISHLIRFCEKNVRIKEVDIFNTAVMKTKQNDTRTVFNKYMDEIVYFFEKTKTELVVIEDIDRFEGTDIFIALRNLNIILNNNKKINGKVRFIYAIKDDLFEFHNERNKFFDFIVPVIPYVSSANSIEVLRKALDYVLIGKEYSRKERFLTFLNLLSPYLNDMRTINNICNEFIVFRSILANEQSLELKDENILAIVVFKNLYPKDYAELEAEKSTSIVRKAFNNRQDLIQEKELLIKANLAAQQDKLDQIEKEALRSVRELKSALLMSLQSPPVAINSIEINKKVYRLATILDDSFDINTLKCSRMLLSVTGSSLPRTVDNVEQFVSQNGDYFSRIEYCTEGLKNSQEKIKREIEAYEHQLNDICSLSMEELIRDFGIGFLDKTVLSNQFLVFLLRNGYLDDTYEIYINYFHPLSIGSTEMNYILGVRNHDSSFGYRTSLHNVAAVFEKLQYYEFKQTEILNIEMVDYVLAEKQNSSAENYLIEQLSDGSSKSMSFIKEYLQYGKCYERIILLICANTSRFWYNIISDNSVSTTSAFEYLNLILRCAYIKDVLKQDEVDDNYHPLSSFLMDNVDSLNIISKVPNKTQIELIKGLNVCFSDHDLSKIHNDIKECIFTNNKYALNPFMMQQLFSWKNPLLLDEYESKNYSAIQHLEYEPLLQRIDEEFSEYIANVFLSIDNNTKEDMAIINLILDRLLPDNYDLCIQVIEKCDYVWNKISECCANSEIDYGETKQQVWQHLLSKNKIICSVENVISYYNNYSFDSVLDDYFSANAEQLLVHINDPVVTDEFKNTALLKISDNNVFRKFVKAAECEYTFTNYQELGYAKVEIIIKDNVFEYSAEDYCQIRDISKELSFIYACNNKKEFLASLSKITLGIDEIDLFLNSSVFEDKDKADILQHFDVNNMSDSLARKISELNFHIDRNTVEAAWPHLSTNEKIRTLIYQIPYYTPKEISSLLARTSSRYEILVASKKHKFELACSNINKRLLDALFQKGYISSYKIENSKSDDKNKIMSGYVKAIPRE